MLGWKYGCVVGLGMVGEKERSEIGCSRNAKYWTSSGAYKNHLLTFNTARTQSPQRKYRRFRGINRSNSTL